MSVARYFLLFGLTFACALMAACDEGGPGMMLTWKCLDKETYISLEAIKLPSGDVQKRSTAITFTSAKTEGLTPDGREIPAWVELSWTEPIDYKNQKSDPSLDEQVAAMNKLPLKTQRVEIGSRIPPKITAQAREAVSNRRKGELPDKYIDIYLTWRQGHVSFRWDLIDRTREFGGKVIASGS